MAILLYYLTQAHGDELHIRPGARRSKNGNGDVWARIHAAVAGEGGLEADRAHVLLQMFRNSGWPEVPYLFVW